MSNSILSIKRASADRLEKLKATNEAKLKAIATITKEHSDALKQILTDFSSLSKKGGH